MEEGKIDWIYHAILSKGERTDSTCEWNQTGFQKVSLSDGTRGIIQLVMKGMTIRIG